MSTSNLMMRPVILSRPENTACLLTIFCAGGAVTTSSPGWTRSAAVAAAGRGPFGWRWPGRHARQRIGRGRGRRAAAEPGAAAGGGAAGRRRQWLGLHRAWRRHGRARRRTDRRRQDAALRNIRHFFGVRILVLRADIARRPRRLIAENVAELRVRCRRERGIAACERKRQGKENGTGRGIARGINQKGESGSQDRKAAQRTG